MKRDLSRLLNFMSVSIEAIEKLAKKYVYNLHVHSSYVFLFRFDKKPDFDTVKDKILNSFALTQLKSSIKPLNQQLTTIDTILLSTANILKDIYTQKQFIIFNDHTQLINQIETTQYNDIERYFIACSLIRNKSTTSLEYIAKNWNDFYEIKSFTNSNILERLIVNGGSLSANHPFTSDFLLVDKEDDEIEIFKFLYDCKHEQRFLSLAVEHNRVKILQFILSSRSTADYVIDNIHIPIIQRRPEILELLLGCSSVAFNQENKMIYHAFEVACICGYEKVVELCVLNSEKLGLKLWESYLNANGEVTYQIFFCYTYIFINRRYFMLSADMVRRRFLIFYCPKFKGLQRRCI